MMRRQTATVLALAVASMGLSGCAPQLNKLRTCTSGSYRYANPNGMTLPSLTVPSPDDLNGAAAASASMPNAPPTPAPRAKSRRAKRAPVVAPPKRGAMLLPSPGTSFRSC
jgi:hypothetical protein